MENKVLKNIFLENDYFSKKVNLSIFFLTDIPPIPIIVSGDENERKTKDKRKN